jgi:GAF domain-containing protein
VPSVDSEAKVLRAHLRTYLDLMTQRSLFLSDLQTTIRRIDEAAATVLRVERVSVWFLDSTATKITCADLFVRSTRAHSSGTELFAKDFAPYFRALRTQRTIAANDAHTDPSTSCFSEVYLTPLGINSMLDVPILHEQKMVGVICHEHVGPRRTWNSDDENFAYLMSNFVALALEKRGTRPVPG